MYQENPAIEDVLAHHGIKGQKWGVRRFQNEDGSYTSAGKKRYGFDGTGKSRKELNTEKAQLQKGKYQELTKGLEDMRKEAFEYGEKHGLDLDDGGGGDAKAGRTYMKMWEKIDALDEKASQAAKEYAKNEFIKKYGEVTLEKLTYQNQMASIGKVLAVTALAVAGKTAINRLKQSRG